MMELLGLHLQQLQIQKSSPEVELDYKMLLLHSVVDNIPVRQIQVLIVIIVRSGMVRLGRKEIIQQFPELIGQPLERKTAS